MHSQRLFRQPPRCNMTQFIEIQAKAEMGFDGGLQRVVKENCTVLHFKNAEFEERD